MFIFVFVFVFVCIFIYIYIWLGLGWVGLASLKGNIHEVDSTSANKCVVSRKRASLQKQQTTHKHNITKHMCNTITIHKKKKHNDRWTKMTKLYKPTTTTTNITTAMSPRPSRLIIRMVRSIWTVSNNH